MSKNRTTYSVDFRRKMIEMARAGQSMCKLAREYGCSHEAIRKWLKQENLNAGSRTDGLSSPDKAEFKKSRSQNRLLREENAILRMCLTQLCPEGFAKEVGNFKFVHSQRNEFKINSICHALGLSKSGYYAWQLREENKRQQRDWKNQTPPKENEVVMEKLSLQPKEDAQKDAGINKLSQKQLSADADSIFLDLRPDDGGTPD